MKTEGQKGGKPSKYVDVKIMGQKFTMMSNEPEEHLYKVADYVNKKIKEIQSKTGTVGAPNLAILAALNIADDYLHSKKDLERIKKSVKSRGKQLVQYLDANLK